MEGFIEALLIDVLRNENIFRKFQGKQVLIIGAGPTGLLIGSLLRDKGVDVTIIEKRAQNTRTRAVKLLGRVLNANLPKNEVNFFSEQQMLDRTEAIQSIKHDLFVKITSFLEMASPIKTIQGDLGRYFTSAGGKLIVGGDVNFDTLKLYPNRFVIDCSGYHSVLLNQIQPNNRVTDFAEFVIVWTFTINARYECNELCKYHKNFNVTRFYQVIPAVDDCYVDKNRITHVTCLITINRDVFNNLSQVKPLTLEYLLHNYPEICTDMNNFLDKFSGNDINKFPNDGMEYIVMPLQVYHARKFTHVAKDLNQHWILMGDAAMSGPYFQSISIGFEAAIYFAHIFVKMIDGNVEKMLDDYENFMEKLWFTVRVRSRDIQRNKEILKSLCTENVDDVLKNIKIY